MKYYAIYNQETGELSKSNCIITNMICIEVSEGVFNELEKYMYSNGSIIPNPNYEHEQEEKEKQRINNLAMTPLDFIKVLEQFGVPFEDSEALINSRADIRKELTYCQNVYCGVVKSFLPITIGSVTVTAEMVEQAFKIKNGEE